MSQSSSHHVNNDDPPKSEFYLSPVKKKSLSGFLSRLTFSSSSSSSASFPKDRNAMNQSLSSDVDADMDNNDNDGMEDGKENSIPPGLKSKTTGIKSLLSKAPLFQNSLSHYSALSSSSSASRLHGSIFYKLTNGNPSDSSVYAIKPDDLSPSSISTSLVTAQYSKYIGSKTRLLSDLGRQLEDYQASYVSLHVHSRKIAETLSLLAQTSQEYSSFDSYLNQFNGDLEDLASYFERRSNQFYEIADGVGGNSINAIYSDIFDIFGHHIELCKEEYDRKIETARKCMEKSKQKSEQAARKARNKSGLEDLSLRLQDLSCKTKEYEKLRLDKMHIALTEQTSFTKDLVSILDDFRELESHQLGGSMGMNEIIDLYGSKQGKKNGSVDGVVIDDERENKEMNEQQYSQNHHQQQYQQQDQDTGISPASSSDEALRMAVLGRVSVRELRQKFMQRDDDDVQEERQKVSAAAVAGVVGNEMTTIYEHSGIVSESCASLDSCASPTTSEMVRVRCGNSNASSKFRDQIRSDHLLSQRNGRQSVLVRDSSYGRGGARQRPFFFFAQQQQQHQ